MTSHRAVRFATAFAAAALVPLLLFAFDAAAGTQRARNGTTFTLPYTSGSGWISGVPMFEIKQDGSGIAGRFEITDPYNAAIALDGVTSGTGHALLAWNLGLGRGAVAITSNPSNTYPALDVSSQSLGSSGFYGLAAAADIRANNMNTVEPAMQVSTLGKGTVLQVNHKGPTGSLAKFQTGGTDRVRISRDGNGLFSGQVRTANYGITQALQPEGLVSSYSPGDVLVVSTATDQRVAKTSQTYSKRVIGVYARTSGVHLTNRSIDSSLSDTLQVGILGVYPTRVSAANGAIHRGDLLATSATPGAAMRASTITPGTIIGKAMGEFPGPGTGIIPVMVTLQ